MIVTICRQISGGYKTQTRSYPLIGLCEIRESARVGAILRSRWNLTIRV